MHVLSPTDLSKTLQELRVVPDFPEYFDVKTIYTCSHAQWREPIKTGLEWLLSATVHVTSWTNILVLCENKYFFHDHFRNNQVDEEETRVPYTGLQFMLSDTFFRAPANL